MSCRVPNRCFSGKFQGQFELPPCEHTMAETASQEACMHPRTMFPRGFVERRDVEQYFWTRSTVHRLIKALEHLPDCCCMAAPSLAVGMHIAGRDERLLDIDRRMDFLPGFQYWDIQAPVRVSACSGQAFRVIIFDPPFFYVSMAQLYAAVLVACKGDTSTKLMLGFLRREEPLLMATFKQFKLRPTKFVLEYANVKPNKWRNYALYSNVDLPGIKRLP
eukprot:jgi/Ulvmu1/722/UM010_0094.1